MKPAKPPARHAGCGGAVARRANTKKTHTTSRGRAEPKAGGSRRGGGFYSSPSSSLSSHPLSAGSSLSPLSSILSRGGQSPTSPESLVGVAGGVVGRRSQCRLRMRSSRQREHPPPLSQEGLPYSTRWRSTSSLALASHRTRIEATGKRRADTPTPTRRRGGRNTRRGQSQQATSNKRPEEQGSNKQTCAATYCRLSLRAMTCHCDDGAVQVSNYIPRQLSTIKLPEREFPVLVWCQVGLSN